MTATTFELTVKSLLAPGKGILAADESFPTIEKRFKARDISSTEENRGTHREMLVTTPRLSEFISGVILFDETIRQRMSHGVPITISKVLAQLGIIPGIKLDKGTVSLSNFPGEKITQGLDGLREPWRLSRTQGALHEVACSEYHWDTFICRNWAVCVMQGPTRSTWAGEILLFEVMRTRCRRRNSGRASKN